MQEASPSDDTLGWIHREGTWDKQRDRQARISANTAGDCGMNVGAGLVGYSGFCTVRQMKLREQDKLCSKKGSLPYCSWHTERLHCLHAVIAELEIGSHINRAHASCCSASASPFKRDLIEEAGQPRTRSEARLRTSRPCFASVHQLPDLVLLNHWDLYRPLDSRLVLSFHLCSDPSTACFRALYPVAHIYRHIRAISGASTTSQRSSTFAGE